MDARILRARWLDWAIKGVGALLLIALGFLIYTVVSTNLSDRASTPTARAVTNLMQAVRDNPNDPNARLLLGDAFAAAGRTREAREQYQAALTLRPDDPQAYAGLAVIAMDQSEWRTAEGYWRKIISLLQEGQYANLDTRLEKAYYHLGSTLMEVHEYEEAAQYLREALRIRRDVSDTYFLLAIAYREMGSDVLYRENIEIALRFDPLLPEANYEMGLILLAEGDTAGAAERFRVSIENAPPGRTEPAQQLAKLGTAEEHLAKSATLATTSPAAALDEARIAAAVDPRNQDAARAVAKLYEQTGDFEAALEAWERLLALAPEDAEAEAAVARLREAS